jgi:hypothetical protein
MTEKETIVISKDKLVLLSKLLKEMKDLYTGVEGKELLSHKFKSQRRIVETLFEDKSINDYIDNLKDRLYKAKLKAQIKEAETTQ